MGIGYLKIEVTSGEGAVPVAGAHIKIKNPDGTLLFETVTDVNGNTGTFPLQAPDKQYTLSPNYQRPAYSVYDVDVYSDDYSNMHIHDVEIVDTQTAILPVNMKPLSDEQNPVSDIDIDIPPVGLLIPAEYHKQSSILPSAVFAERTINQVIIPDYITVHLGTPTNAAARNVRVRFVDYVKNVTSSEIYSTWPYNSIVANVHCIVTFALNRVFTEWYRSRGFEFDITNSTSYDQYYREGAVIFENISQIVDGIFNVYAHRYGFRNPFFTEFCNGSTVTCPGLSQWGTVTLAKTGN